MGSVAGREWSLLGGSAFLTFKIRPLESGLLAIVNISKKWIFLISLLQISKVALKIESSCATKQSPEASTLCPSNECLILMVTQLFHVTFEICNKPYFFQHCHVWNFNSFWPQNQVVDPSVFKHEIDGIGQTNIHDLSEKYPLPNFMMKTASFHKVKIFWKFDCIQHWSTKWLLAPTFGGPNFFLIISPES